MKRTARFSTTLLAAACLTAWCAPARSQPKPAPAKPPARSATTQPARFASPAVMKILAGLEEAGMKFPGARHATVRADLEYTHVDEALGDTELRKGWVAYQKADKAKAKDGQKTPAKFRIQFDTLKMGRGRTVKDIVDYAFDGYWLTVAKHRIKTITRYQVVAEGQKVEPTRLGRGPLPLPFGQKSEDMLEHFDITTRDTKKGEPPGTTFLLLVTRPGYRKSINIKSLKMWIDSRQSLPVKIISTDKNDNSTTIVFTNMKTGEKFDASMFLLPRRVGWTFSVKRLQQGASLVP